MKLLDIPINTDTRAHLMKIYPIGDIHVGALNCAEDKVKGMVKLISGDPTAYWIGGGDYCMPLNTRILTRRGFLEWDALIKGELVAGYKDGNLVWTPLRSVYLTPAVPMRRMHTSTFDIVCSEHHGWWTVDNQRARRAGKESEAVKTDTSKLRASDRIIVAAPLMGITDTDGNPVKLLDISDEEATLFGWLITDGCISKYRDPGKSYRACISQSLKKYAAVISSKLGRWFTSEKLNPEQGTCGMMTYNIGMPKFNALCTRLGIPVGKVKQTMPTLVPSMPASAQRCMFEAMLQAEGWFEGRWRFCQSYKNSPVMETFQILATLLGNRLTPTSRTKNGIDVCSVVNRSNMVTGADLRHDKLPPSSAWCPMTDCKSWVCEQDGQVTITGNCDAVILNDSKRFDPTVVPNWMLSEGPEQSRTNLKDMLQAQRKRLSKLLAPIRDRCLGLIEGNHEYTIMKHHNRDLMKELCSDFSFCGKPAVDLTDCSFIRFKFRRGAGEGHTSVMRLFICHGNGGGRTSGAESNALYRLAADKECDIVLRGHSHSFCIHPPIPMLSVPSAGVMPTEATVYDKHAANWGAYVYTYANGPSTYASRGNFPLRPMYTVGITIKPHHTNSRGVESPRIDMREVKL